MGSRKIDLDILFYNDLIFSDEIITLPHKGIIYRDFVMIPLIEIEPGIIHPVFNKKVSEFISGLTSTNILSKIPKNFLWKKKILASNEVIKFIAVEGVIGAGKTALAKKLKSRLEAKLILEQFEANPFLGKFLQ